MFETLMKLVKPPQSEFGREVDRMIAEGARLRQAIDKSDSDDDLEKCDRLSGDLFSLADRFADHHGIRATDQARAYQRIVIKRVITEGDKYEPTMKRLLHLRRAEIGEHLPKRDRPPKTHINEMVMCEIGEIVESVTMKMMAECNLGDVTENLKIAGASEGLSKLRQEVQRRAESC